VEVRRTGRRGRAEKLLLDAESEGLITIVDRAVVSWPARSDPADDTAQ
jgi:hypothetical protein